MQVEEGKKWKLLFSKLRRSDDARVSYAEVEAVGADPTMLVSERLLEYGKADAYEPAGCEHLCTPNLDFDARKSEGLVGVACPYEPPCWSGWRWVARTEVDSLRCRSRDVFAVLRARNGLEPLGGVPPPFVGVGLLRRRGMSVAVVWLRWPTRGFEQMCRGVRAQLGSDALIVLVAKNPRVQFPAGARIATIELLDDIRGDLGLGRALEELTPDYRTRILKDETLDLDYVRMRFSTRPGDRHVVEINGHDFAGFRKSDVKFLRLLLLAAARKNGKGEGWVDKSRLRDGDDKDRALENLRAELVSPELSYLSKDERRALVRSQKGGSLRLAIPPENIEYDDSLARLEFVGPTTTVKKGETNVKMTKKQSEGLRNAAILLNDCRKLGVPGSPGAAAHEVEG